MEKFFSFLTVLSSLGFRVDFGGKMVEQEMGMGMESELVLVPKRRCRR